ncbi:MAG: hypothetical protein IKH92_04835 [Clostridiales bacterium]|nr:hypothetical protein [Clostridiales bacterium]
MSERIKRFMSNCAVFITAALLLNTFSPYVKSVKAAGTTEIHDENIINIRAHQDGSAFSGELDYHIPSSITEENGIVTYDFSKVLAYSQDASGAFTTNNESALDFSKFTLEGPILIENSIFNSKFENEINEFKNTQDSTALRNAGYPYWYSFDKNGLVELDYTAIFTKNAEGQCDYDTLYDKNTQSFTALSYVVFSCELNKEAFSEGGGDFILSFISDPITDDLNPHVKIDPPTKLDRDIEVTKECTDFNFDKGTVSYKITVTNKGDKAISNPIEIKDTLDDGLSFVSVTSYESQYIDPNSSKNSSSVRYFILNDLPASGTTTITYTCRLNSKFYMKSQTQENNIAGNTVTASSVPVGGVTPVPVELNSKGDLSIRVTPPNVSYDKISKTGSYSNERYSWTILVNNGNGTLHSDLRDVVVFDEITYNTDNNPVLLDGKVTITNAKDPSLSHTVTGVTIDSFKDPGIKLLASWFDNTDSDGIYIGEPKDQYKISYTTTAGDNVSSLTVDQKVTNVASMRDGTRWIGSVGRDVVGPSGFSLRADKEIDDGNVTYSEEGSNTTVYMPWVITAYVPYNFDDEIIFSDYLAATSGMSFDFDRMSSAVANIYYVNENQEEVHVPSTMSLKTQSDGSTILEADVSKEDASSLRGRTLYWKVATKATVKTERLAENEVIFHNGGNVNDKSLDAAFSTRGPVYYMNKHSVKFDASTSDATWQLVYNYDNTGHVLERHNWTSIHIVDDLHGMIFTGSSGRNDQVKTIINNQDGSPYYAYARDNGDGTFEIFVDEDHPLKDKKGNEFYLSDLIKNGERIVFEYHTTIPTSIYPVVNKGKVENTATSTNKDENGTPFVQTPSAASVAVDYPIVKKTDVGSIHDYDKVDYVITVNPYALNLSRDGSGSYYVVDTLGDNIDYVVKSLKVYEKQAGSTNKEYEAGDKLYTQDTVVDQHVSAGKYEFMINGKDLVLRVPEGVTLNISYTVKLSFATSGKVTNSASLPLTYPGNKDEEAGRIESSKTFEISSSSAGTRPHYALFYIEKVGENDPSTLLGNIKFIADEYDLHGDPTHNVFNGTTVANNVLTADQFEAPQTQTQKTIRENYIYVVYEDPNQVAPEGYTISTEKIAFYIPSNENHIADATCDQKLGVKVQSVVQGKDFIFVNGINHLTISKDFNSDGGDASQVKFTIKGTGSTNFAETEFGRNSNKFSISNLPEGTYEIAETATASGYDKLAGKIQVSVNSKKEITVSTPNGVSVLNSSNSTTDVAISVLNTKTKGYVTINKTVTGAESQADIEGLTFTVTYKDLDGKDVSVTKTLGSDFTITKSGNDFVCTLKNVIEVPDASKSVLVEETNYDLSAKGYTSSKVSSRVGNSPYDTNENTQSAASVSTNANAATSFGFKDEYTKPAPVVPAKPSEPSTSDSSNPSTPSEPSTPSTPSEPTTPSAPSEPSTPSAPSEPTESSVPAETTEETTTTTIDETSETSEPFETPTTTEPTGQVKEAERKKIVKTGESSSYKEYFALLLLLAATSIFFLVGKKKKSE